MIVQDQWEMNTSGMELHVNQHYHSINHVLMHQLATCVKHLHKVQYAVAIHHHHHSHVNVHIFNILIHIQANVRIKLDSINHVMQVYQICVSSLMV